jgi:hypothetical protein
MVALTRPRAAVVHAARIVPVQLPPSACGPEQVMVTPFWEQDFQSPVAPVKVTPAGT